MSCGSHSRSGSQTVRFVHRDARLVERILSLPSNALPLEMSPPLDISEGANAWIAQSFMHLRRHGLPVQLASTLSPSHVNVLHYDHVPGWKRFPFWAFFAVVQADRPRPMIADVRMVQNKLCIQDVDRDRFVPLWSQPCLRPRDPARGDRLSTIAYMGLECYLALPFREAKFKERLAAAGVSFEPHFRPEEWSDYSAVDAILAVRNVTPYDLSIKPATKLINAWKAGVLPLLGREPAYTQVGRPGVNYCEVSSAEDVIRAVHWAQDNPADAARVRQSGACAFQMYNDEQTIQRWVEILAGTLLPAFEQWRREGALSHLLKLPGRLAKHRREAAFFRANI